MAPPGILRQESCTFTQNEQIIQMAVLVLKTNLKSSFQEAKLVWLKEKSLSTVTTMREVASEYQSTATQYWNLDDFFKNNNAHRAIVSIHLQCFRVDHFI